MGSRCRFGHQCQRGVVPYAATVYIQFAWDLYKEFSFGYWRGVVFIQLLMDISFVFPIEMQLFKAVIDFDITTCCHQSLLAA